MWDIPSTLLTDGLHLDQETLELAQKTRQVTQGGSGNQGGHVGQDVTGGGVEDQSVDGFVEGAGAHKGDHNEAATQEREGGVDTLNGAHGVELADIKLAVEHLGEWNGCAMVECSFSGWRKEEEQLAANIKK